MRKATPIMSTNQILRPPPASARQLSLPRAIAGGSRRGWIAALLAGVVFGGATLLIPMLLPADDALGFLAILLGEIGAVYLGFVLMDGRSREFRIEYAGIVVFTAMAAAALAMRAPALLAAGYFAHGLWDIVHGPRGIHTHTPRWYAPLCVGFDAVVGAYLLIAF
jgi:hypothetical protein